jgi:hypothetical protein
MIMFNTLLTSSMDIFSKNDIINYIVNATEMRPQIQNKRTKKNELE